MKVPVLAAKVFAPLPLAVRPLAMTGLVSVLFVRVLVLPRVGTLAAFVPAVVMRSSPVPIVRMPLECVTATLPLLKFSTAPVARKRSLK